MPEGESARDDKSDEKANQKEPAVGGERDQQRSYDCEGDDETRRSPQAESRAAAGFRLHKFYFSAAFTASAGTKSILRSVRFYCGVILVCCRAMSGRFSRELSRVDHSLPRKIAAITRGLRRPCNTATTHNGFSSGA